VRQALAGRSDAPPAGGAFERVLAEHMGYWEQHIPAGQQCFVHYAIGKPDVIDGLFDRLSATAGFPLLGTYSLEAQSCCYPFGFPTNPVPDNVSLGDSKTFTDQSIFWFNFFPAQPYLFEKTFVVWTRFCSSSLPERGECNQLVSASTANRVRASGVDEFVQVNLNRFTNLNGFLASARGAGESTFTVDPDYRWYGMLLRKL
ncbi:MAG TPA: hypothetical protein VFS62_11575, partial [Chloroflexota bacterium]|nr:hypothetical protein [Chloroflexota bacterium]